jgi:hypothetical protein
MTLNAVIQARHRLQSGVLGMSGREGGKEQLQPGTITIGGTSYVCAVHLGKVEYRQNPDTGNWQRLQPLIATVRKALLAAAPGKKTVITFGGNQYQIDEVGGQNSTDLDWVLKSERKLPSPS